MSWAPLPDDRDPWVEVTFTAPAEVDKVMLHCLTKENRPALSAGRITVFDGATRREVAKFWDNQSAIVILSFPKTKCISVRLHVDKIDPRAQCRLLSELEVYGRLVK